MNFKMIFYVMNISLKDYIIKFVIPIISMGILFPLILKFVAPDIFIGAVGFFIYLVPIIFL